jgi:hypothetical protein
MYDSPEDHDDIFFNTNVQAAQPVNYMCTALSAGFCQYIQDGELLVGLPFR